MTGMSSIGGVKPSYADAPRDDFLNIAQTLQIGPGGRKPHPAQCRQNEEKLKTAKEKVHEAERQARQTLRTLDDTHFNTNQVDIYIRNSRVMQELNSAVTDVVSAFHQVLIDRANGCDDQDPPDSTSEITKNYSFYEELYEELNPGEKASDVPPGIPDNRTNWQNPFHVSKPDWRSIGIAVDSIKGLSLLEILKNVIPALYRGFN